LENYPMSYRSLGRVSGCVLLSVATGFFCAVSRGAEPANSPPAVSSPDSTAASGSAEKLDPAALVRQLGDDSYQARTQAAEQLAELGLKAREALLVGRQDRDPQIRRACRWLLGEVLEADFQQRLKAFQADATDKDDHGFSGWRRFSTIIGIGPEAGDQYARARSFFIEMLKKETGLMESIPAGPVAKAETMTLRLQQVTQARNLTDSDKRKLPSIETTAALLLIATDPAMESLEKPNDFSTMLSIVQYPDFYMALLYQEPTDEEKKKMSEKDKSEVEPKLAAHFVAQKLLGQWIMRCGSESVLSSKLNLALNFDLKEGLVPALRIVQNRQMANQSLRAQAIGFVGKWGGLSHAKAISDLLDDDSGLFKGKMGDEQVEIQIRDVALAWLIHLTDQDHAAYQMPRAKANFKTMRDSPTSGYIPSYTEQGFASDEKREAALKLWKEYAAAHPLPPLPPVLKPVDVASPVDATADAKAPPPGAQRTATAPTRQPPGASLQTKLVSAERAKSQLLGLAKQLLDQKNYAQATRLLDDILTSDTDYAFKPDITVTFYRSMKAEAEQMLSQMPAEARDAYRLQFEVVARRALEEAVRLGEVAKIKAVSERFFHLPTGAEATFILAAHERDRGRPMQAAMLLEKLRNRSPDAKTLEPALSLMLANCWTAAGLSQTAAKVAVKSDWSMFRGEPGRNGRSGDVALRPRPVELISTCDDADILDILLSDRTKQLDLLNMALPSVHPLLIGDTVVLRTATQLSAVDPANGKLLWSAPLEDPLRYYLLEKYRDPSRIQSKSFIKALQRRFWEDMSFGAISSNGSMVFGVEDLQLDTDSIAPKLTVGADGLRHLDTEGEKPYNLLTAYDVRTGKLKWEIGGPAGAGMLELAGTRFLGPPLPLGGRLYVTAQRNGNTCLLELDAQSGSMLSELSVSLQDAEQLPEATGTVIGGGIRFRGGMGGFATGTALPPNPMLHSGSSPSYADGTLVFYIGARQYVAYNLLTRAVSWVYQAPERELARNGRGMMGVRAVRANDNVNDEIGTHWMDDSIIITSGRVLLTPPESDEIHCINLTDGRLLWSAPRRMCVYLGGVDDGNIVMVGFYNLWKVNLEDASAQSVTLPPTAASIPSGRGLISQGRYLLPLTSGQILTVDLKTMKKDVFQLNGKIVPGNLMAWRDTLLSQSIDGLWRFDQESEKGVKNQ
jgi:outer membrane protein assembly factor BamB